MDVGSIQEKLLQALLDDNLPEFKGLLGHPAVNPAHKYGKPHYSSCLEIACRQLGKEEFIRALLTKVKPNINQIVPEPIHYAARIGNVEALEVLLKDKRTKVNAEDSSGRTALHVLAMNFKDNEHSARFAQCVAMLLSRPDIDINRPNKKGFTALHEAVNFGSKKAVEVFLKYGETRLDLDSFQGHGRTAREVILLKYPELKANLPVSKAEDICSTNPHTQLLMALKKGFYDVFCALLKQVDSYGNPVLDPNHWYDSPVQSTCLEMACYMPDREKFVLALLQAGADANMVNPIDEKSPLHVAVSVGNHAAVKQILFAENTNVNINVLDKLGKAPLHYSVELNDVDESTGNNRLKCLALLLNRVDLNVNILDKDGKTAIILALACRNKQAVDQMIRHGVHTPDLDTFLGFDRKSAREDIMNEFPELRSCLPPPQVFQSPKQSSVAMLFQYLYKKQENEFAHALNTLKDLHPQVLNMDDGNNTLLQFASRYGLQTAVEALLSRGADPNHMCSENKFPPAVLASHYRHFDTLHHFLSLKNFDINAVDMKGNTALHHAVKNVHLESVIALLGHGADLHLRNVLGKGPLSAKELGTLLDLCIKTNNKFPTEENYEIIFDYRLLTALTSSNVDKISRRRKNKYLGKFLDKSSVTTDHRQAHEYPEAEMLFLSFVSKSKDIKESLKHPVAASFLELKWRRVGFLSYINLAVFSIFVLFLTIYITPDYGESYYTRNIEHADEDAVSRTIRICLLSCVVALLVRELFQLTTSVRLYVTNAENVIDLSLICLTGYITIFPTPRPNAARQIVSVTTIVLAWVELLLLIGRLPVFARNIEMLKIVLKNYVYMCSSYIILLIIFTLSFHTLYQDSCRSSRNETQSCDETDLGYSSSLPMSFLKTITMMTGEYETEKMMFRDMPVIVSILFVMFVLLITIALLNLLIGMAVNDTHTIQKNAELLCLQSRVRVTLEIEGILTHFHELLVLTRAPCTYLHRSSLFPPQAEHKQGIIRPNIGPNIELSTQYRPCKLKRKLLDEALRILNSKSQLINSENDVTERLDNLELSTRKVLEVLDTINQRLSEDLSDTRSRYSN
ncbi:transient receptor potential cation channel protein painless-like [Anabrus simplex]|uniref:transient receptor potential cation channel protein painless-like n=1 Tax=Anabrus simplex TaxID=316456 RepID=UPI0035A3D4C0